MAQREWFEYVNPSTGKKEFECPALAGQNILSGMVVANVADDFASTCKVVLWAALCADAAGHRVLPRGVKRTADQAAFIDALAKAVSAGFVIDFADRYTISFHQEDVSDGDGDVDENPTGTSLESL